MNASPSSAGAAYLADARQRFEETRKQAERALAQVPFERWAERLDPGANSLVTLMLHVSGNQVSRWTNFLTTDGEKPDRNRDAEFEDASLSREQLLARWDRGWTALFDAIDALREEDLLHTVMIRGEPHTVLQAVNRQIAHYALHVGQMLFLAKHLAGPAWQHQSLPRRGRVT